MTTTILYAVVQNFEMYRLCISENPNCRSIRKLHADNTKDNKGIPTQYNAFLDSYDFAEPAWIVFCHEDFEIQEPLTPILESLSPNALYGPIGCARKGIFPFRHQVFLGQLLDKTGQTWHLGKSVTAMTKAETFDCCCLIVHSSLIKKYHLRFDEKLMFDLYVEDFCATAKVKHHIESHILPFKAIHHSGSRPTERLYRHLPYLRMKYPHNCFCASCTYFGTPSLPMRFERTLAKVLSR